MAFATPFSSPNFQPMIPAQTGVGLVPAALYKAKFYEAGTDIPKTIYTDSSITVPYANPSSIAFLDDDGKALIYLGVGGYKLVLTDPNDNPVPGWTIDNLIGGGGVAFATGFVNSFADLADVNTTIFPYTYIGGYYAPGDGGEGMFYNAVSGDSPDGGYIQSSTFDPTKRWFRIPDENGDVRAASFGYIPANSGDQSSEFAAAENYASTVGANLLVQSGSTATIDSKLFSCVSVTFAAGAGLKGTTGTESFIFGSTIVIAPDQTIFTNYGSVSLSSAQVSSPYWFGGNPSIDNTGTFASWFAAGSGTFILPPGVWIHDLGTYNPPAGANILYQGTIDLGGSDYILPGANYGELSKITGTLDLDLTGNIDTTGAISVGAQVYSAGGFYTDGYVRAVSNIFNTTGDIHSANDVTAVNAVTAGAYISCGLAIDAGAHVTAGTYVQAKAGTSTRNFKAAGACDVVIGVGDAGLMAGELSKDNDYIHIICAGASTSTTPTATVTVGGQVVFSCATIKATSAPSNYVIDVRVFRTSATTSFSIGTVTFNPTSVTAADLVIPSGSDTRTAAITWSNSNVISHSFTGATKALTMYEFYPAI